MVHRELSWKAKPVVTCGHELWIVTERMRSWIQADEISFLCRVAGLSLRDRVRSSDIRRELGVEPLLLCSERSQLRASDQDHPGGPPGMSNWQETLG